MKIHFANYKDSAGGGWTIAKYLKDHFGQTEYQEADIYFLCGATFASHDEVDQAKRDGKKVVMRVDNALLNSRNRGTGMSRMEHFAELSDLLIYQSNWARDYLKPFLKKDGVIILNGADTKLFNKQGRTDEEVYLYSRFNRDESKNWNMARYWFSRKFQVDKSAKIIIVGKFSPENVEYNFDFYQGENYTYLGVQPLETLAGLYKQSRFLYSYFNDACSNSLIEAKLSGCEIIDVSGMLGTGGAPEIMECEDLSIDRMLNEYSEAMNVIL